MLLIALSFVTAFVVCLAVRSRAVVAAAVGLWPVYFAGLLLGAWGYEVGDNWQYAAVTLTVVSAAGAVAGIVVGRRLPGVRLSPPKRDA